MGGRIKGSFLWFTENMLISVEMFCVSFIFLKINHIKMGLKNERGEPGYRFVEEFA